MFDAFKKKAAEDVAPTVKPIPYDNNDYGDVDHPDRPLTEHERNYVRQHSGNPISELVRDTVELNPELPPALDEKKN